MDPNVWDVDVESIVACIYQTKGSRKCNLSQTCLYRGV